MGKGDNAGQSEEAQPEAQVSAETQAGQSDSSPEEPTSAIAKIAKGIELIDAEQKPAEQEQESAAEGESESKGEGEETPAEETPAKGEAAPEKTEEPKPAPAADSDLQGRLDALEKRLPGFQTALNEKHEELMAAHATVAEQAEVLKELVTMVEESLENDEQRQAVRKRIGDAQTRGRAAVAGRRQAAAIEGRLQGYLTRLEKAGMELEGDSVVDRLMSAAKQGIDIAVDAATPQDALVRFADSVSSYEGKVRHDALQAEVNELRRDRKDGEKKAGRKRVQQEIAGGAGAANLGGATGPMLDPDKTSPIQKIRLGLEAHQAAGT